MSQGLEPQLALEALIFSRRYQIDFNKITDLQYLELKGKDKNKINSNNDSESLIKAAQNGIEELFLIFQNESTPYICAPNESIYQGNDYNHLARVKEWK